MPKQTKVRLSVVLCQIGQSYNDIIAVGNVGDPVQSIIITIGHFNDFFLACWWAPLLVDAPVRLHMLHMPKSGPEHRLVRICESGFHVFDAFSSYFMVLTRGPPGYPSRTSMASRTPG